jgi:putative sigma-54 modulation protein
MMQISVTSKKMELTPAIRSYAEEKIGRLDKFLDGILEAHVLLRIEKHRHIAEATLRARQADFTGKENNEDLYAAIDRVADKLERQMRKYKTRTLSRRKKKGIPKAELSLDSGRIAILGEPDGGANVDTLTRPVVQEKFIHLDQLTVEEAISRMEVHGDSFWVYTDSDRGEMSVVYRRKDGSYGLIQPEN